MKRFYILSIVIIATSFAHGGGFPSLKLGADARSGSMGMAGTALSSDGTALSKRYAMPCSGVSSFTLSSGETSPYCWSVSKIALYPECVDSWILNQSLMSSDFGG